MPVVPLPPPLLLAAALAAPPGADPGATVGLLVGVLLLGLTVGGVAGAALVAVRSSQQRMTVQVELARVQGERDSAQQRLALVEAGDRSAGELVAALAPLSETVERVRTRVEGLERERAAQLGSLAEQVRGVHEVGLRLHEETAALAGAMSSPTARGSWGELQLERVVEAAGMLRHVDFATQVSVSSEAASAGGTRSGRLRPDLVVHLPGERVVVVDAKAPVLLEADGRVQARALRGHIDALSAKGYWRAFDRAPELVVCFVPAESVLAAALAADGGLLEYAMRARVVPATPATLLALLRTVAVTWREHAVHDGAKEVLALGRELYARLGTVVRHTDGVGRALGRAVEDYNRLVGSMESRLLVSARRLTELDLVDDEIDMPQPVTAAARPPSSTEPEPIAPEVTGSKPTAAASTSEPASGFGSVAVGDQTGERPDAAT